MTNPSFDVLRKPWIPILRGRGGPSDELGILPCLEQAHEILEIRDPSPIVEFGLHRLLVAFLLDALIESGHRPDEAHDLRELRDDGRFDMELLSGYAERCGDVFNLFHREMPFLQTVMTTSTRKPLAGMYPAVPSGTNASIWHHASESEMTVDPAEAARLLSSIAPFMTAGGAGLSPSINGAPAIYALPVGRTLFETLILNLPLRKSDTGDGSVAWRDRRVPGEDRTQATMVESLTWRPRRIQLIPETDDNGNVTVRWMKYEKGDSTRLTWTDPNLAYRFTADKSSPVRMREGRPVWRDAGPLLLLNKRVRGSNDEKTAFERPDVIDTAYELSPVDGYLVIHAYGMRTDMKMKVFEWIRSAFTVPSGLGRTTRLGSIVHLEIDRAERASFILRTSIKSLFPRDAAGNKNALKTMTDRCERSFWQRLEHEFQPLMDAFARLDPDAADDPALISETSHRWRSTVRSLATEQFELAAKDMDTDGNALERQIRSRNRMNASLRKVLDGN